jgi:hypothetical protein
VDTLIENIKHYIENRIELVKLDIQQAAAKGISAGIFYGSLFFLGLFFFMFLNISLGLIINEAMDSSYMGFVIVTIIYLVLIILLFVLKKSMNLDLKAEKMAAKMFEKKKQP